MTWGSPRSYPRAILHVDGDSFFASCEVAKDPRLRGRPIITGKERGIVSAMTYDVKRAGVTRGMILSEAKKICPDAIILSSDYETYSLFSERMYKIVRRYSPMVEEYSIDECFADLTGLRRTLRMNYPQMARAIKEDLQRELGMTFSVGLSATKVLAKLGSKWQKPDGLTCIPLRDSRTYLRKTAAGKIWGIGPNTAAYLQKFGIETAFDFAERDEEWIRTNVSKPYLELWRELNGETAYEFTTEHKSTYRSIQKTRTFTPPSRDREFIFSQLSKNVENACIKARRWNLATTEIFFFLKTQDFRYHGCEMKLSHSTNVPQDILNAVAEYYPCTYRKGVLYRTTGITLMKLRDAGSSQLDLFGAAMKTEGLQRIFESVDELSERFGKHVVFLGSSFHAMTHLSHAGERGELTSRQQQLFKGEHGRRRLGLPMLGEVS
ncbi:MAG TPA: DNA polymerase IV [Candidatus Paceibacterota bacterium]|jgi:DNA polymerase-4/DNA polymerase V|nr:DNA polymerase IV [Candidatus Paceibacterota bacterium]